MNPTLSFWITLIGRLAVEGGLLVALAAAVQPWVATPWRRRALWQMALLGIALTWSAEIGGWRQEILRRWPEPRPKTQVLVRSMAEPMPAFEPMLTPANPAPEMGPPPAVVQKPVWWPLQLWAAGTGLLGLRSLSFRIWLLLAALRRTRVEDSELLGTVERLRARVGLRRVRVLAWPGLRSPIAFGLWTPTIALPAEFTSRFDDGAQEAILAHELAHLAARDPLWLGIADGVLALAWWHPAVWWSRHQLRAACESAADDASALVPDGRVRLAELLVSLGRDLVSPGWTRGLGVAGDGFKSQLARRVTALLKASHDWRADRSSRMWWTRVAALGVTALLVAIPWPGTSGPALTALIQEARATSAEKPGAEQLRLKLQLHQTRASPIPQSTFVEESTNLVSYEFNNLFRFRGSDLGRANTIWVPAASTNTIWVPAASLNWLPAHSVTFGAIREPGFSLTPLSQPTPSARPGEARVNAQLDQIILPSYLERDRPGKVLGQSLLSRRWWLVDTNLFWSMVRSNRPAPAEPSNPLNELREFFATQGISFPRPEAASVSEQNSMGFMFSGRLMVSAKASELDQIDRILAPVKLKPTPRAVATLASNRAESTAPIASAQPADLLERIQKVDARLRDLRTHYKDTHPKVQEVIAERMALVGGASSGATNRFVKMEVKLVEVREPNSSRLGLDWVFGPAQTNQAALSSGSAQEFAGAPGDPRSENYHVDLFRSVSEVATVSSNQFAALLKRLEAEPGTELVSAPSVLTDNGRQSVVSVTQEISMVDGVNAVPGSPTNQAQIRYNTTKMQIGPTVELLPVFVGDSLRMHVLAKITEFLGYDQPKPGQSVQTKDSKGKTLEGIQPLPHLRVRVAVADPVLRRGETAVLRGPLVTETVLTKEKVPVLGDVPLLGRLFRSESTTTFKKRLYVFVTPTEMDAAGNPK